MVQRRSRRYDGTEVPTRSLSDLLPQILGEISRKSAPVGKLGKEAISLCWTEILGEKMAPLTECISWVDGVLTVKVKSATLYSLLCQHEKVRLLKKLQEQFPIRNLVFRVG